jgi:sensor histidine kinase YesM
MTKNTKNHIIGLGIFSAVAMVLDLINYRSDFRIVRELVFLGIEFWIFYSFVWVLNNFRFHTVQQALKAIGLLVLSIGVNFVLNYFRGWVGQFYGVTMFNNASEFFVNSLTLHIHVGLYSVGYYYFRRSLSRQKQMAEAQQHMIESERKKLEAENRILYLQEEKTQLQSQLLEMENNFLRAQINPHFLFNCLNFFYSEVLNEQPKVAEGIITLSQIMRYSLQDFSRLGGMANLQDELENIENIIKIHQMRFDDSLHIQFEQEGEAGSIKIPPMILMTLVENVFKYGEMHHPDSPALISCRIDRQRKRISFTTKNKKKIQKPAQTPGSGIGLINIRQRMKQVYRENFQLQVGDDARTFAVSLEFLYDIDPSSESLVLPPTNFAAC